MVATPDAGHLNGWTTMQKQNAEDERSTDLETTVCRDGRHINVRNPLSGSGEAHTVHLSESGSVEGCTCKGWKFHETCYHVGTVRQSPLLIASAKVLSAVSQSKSEPETHDYSPNTYRDKTETAGVVDLE